MSAPPVGYKEAPKHSRLVSGRSDRANKPLAIKIRRRP